MTTRNLPYVNAYGTVDISRAKNVDEALKFAGLDWEVESRHIYDAQGNPYPNYKANVNKENGDMLGVVTDRYRIVQNRDAFNFVDSLVDEGFIFDRAGSFRDGKSIWVMGSLPDANILGDDVANNIVFTNSHDGSSGVKIMMTPVRLICSNMMNYAIREAQRMWTSKHTGSITFKLQEAKETLGLAQKYMTELEKEAERLAMQKISEQQIEAIFDKMFPVDASTTARKINNIAIMKDNYMTCYNAEDLANFKGTVYGALQAMSDYVSHKAPARASNNYYANRWNTLVNGDAILDGFYKAVR